MYCGVLINAQYFLGETKQQRNINVHYMCMLLLLLVVQFVVAVFCS